MEIGVSTPSQVEVKDGIEAGELVVVGNLALLRDGLSVMVEPEPSPEAEPEVDGAQGEGQPDRAAPDEAPAQEQPAEEASTEQS